MGCQSSKIDGKASHMRDPPHNNAKHTGELDAETAAAVNQCVQDAQETLADHPGEAGSPKQNAPYNTKGNSLNSTGQRNVLRRKTDKEDKSAENPGLAWAAVRDDLLRANAEWAACQVNRGRLGSIRPNAPTKENLRRRNSDEPYPENDKRHTDGSNKR